MHCWCNGIWRIRVARRRSCGPGFPNSTYPIHSQGSLRPRNGSSTRFEGGETILVHGDYDVDGIAGATLLTRWIRRIGGNAVPFVPHRLRDGYDFGAAGIAAAREAGADLILTVDSGIRAHDAVADANAAGLDVIVTDHHTPAETLPPALAVINPNRVDCGYPNKGLCGTGVAYRLCEALVRKKGNRRGGVVFVPRPRGTRHDCRRSAAESREPHVGSLRPQGIGSDEAARPEGPHGAGRTRRRTDRCRASRVPHRPTYQRRREDGGSDDRARVADVGRCGAHVGTGRPSRGRERSEA